MGTLTAGQPRLPGYCEHKLPTSCRLSSIQNCCACADERPHAASYSTYIDGIGFVPRGNRWQRYCWFCKEFWENRVRVSGLRPAQTRIPAVPDQTQFLERWYDFHRGYRVVESSDGTQERIAVLGEDFKDVTPGCLPRTLEELRAGREPTSAVIHQPQSQVGSSMAVPQVGPSLDETLDQMFQAALLEGDEQQHLAGVSDADRLQPQLQQQQQEPEPRTNIHAQAMVPADSRNMEQRARRVAALRRELYRLANGMQRVITGLRDLGEGDANRTDTTESLDNLVRDFNSSPGGPSPEDAQRAIDTVNALTDSVSESQPSNALADIQARINGARDSLNESRRSRDQAASQLESADAEFRTNQQRLQQLQREQLTTENYMRLFGTREEMIEQGENYVSPIGSMFTRAEERFHAAEALRREVQTLRHVLQDEARSDREIEMTIPAEPENTPGTVWRLPAIGQGGVIDPEPTQWNFAGLNNSNTYGAHGAFSPTVQDSVQGALVTDDNIFSEGASRGTPRAQYNGALPDRPSSAEREDYGNEEVRWNASAPLAELPADEDMERNGTLSIAASLNMMPRVNAVLSREWLAEAQYIVDWLDERFQEDGVLHEEHQALFDNCQNGINPDGLTTSHIEMIDYAIREEEWAWKSGLLLFRVKRFRATHGSPFEHGSPRTLLAGQDQAGNRLARQWNIGVMASAFLSSTAVRDFSALTGPECMEILDRMRTKRSTSADLELMNELIRTSEAQELANKAMLSYTQEEWQENDILHTLLELASNEQLRRDYQVTFTPQSHYEIIESDGRNRSMLRVKIPADVLSRVQNLIADEEFAWRVRLPTMWLLRRTIYASGSVETGALILSRSVTLDESENSHAARINPFIKIELAAQAYQTHSIVMQQIVRPTPPDRQEMVSRLRNGERNGRDRDVLEDALYTSPALVYQLFETEDRIATLRSQAHGQQPAALLHQDPEHDQNPTGAQALAVAAGRLAMRTGSSALFAQMADRDNDSRAAYRRLQDNGYGDPHSPAFRSPAYRQLSFHRFAASDSDDDDSDSEADTPRGLDAVSTGRPEPKGDEEMQMMMDCKICYTQVSEIACLPCGHLVMCRWCSDQHSPTTMQDPTRPRRPARCPMCRKNIKSKVRVFRP